MPLLTLMQPKKRNKCRQWKNRPKVSSKLSKDFPWEVVLRFLGDHPRSLILLQMVDKNLNNLISTDNRLWLSKFNKEIKNTAYCNRTVKDPTCAYGSRISTVCLCILAL